MPAAPFQVNFSVPCLHQSNNGSLLSTELSRERRDSTCITQPCTVRAWSLSVEACRHAKGAGAQKQSNDGIKMTLKLREYIELLKRAPEVPSFEPDLDDLDEKQDKKLRYASLAALSASGLLVVVSAMLNRPSALCGGFATLASDCLIATPATLYLEYSILSEASIPHPDPHRGEQLLSHLSKSSRSGVHTGSWMTCHLVQYRLASLNQDKAAPLLAKAT